MGAEQALKRIPRIKFPQRHPKPSASGKVAKPRKLGYSFNACLKKILNHILRAEESGESGCENHLSFNSKTDVLVNEACAVLRVGSPSFMGNYSFPRVVPGSGTQATSKDGNIVDRLISRTKSDVPAPPINTAVGGKASLLPKRTPVSDKEIEAILEAASNLEVDKASSNQQVNLDSGLLVSFHFQNVTNVKQV
ncbi:hypothetical protein COLO4_03427 [Corchorus olitorius]|uniref:Uncharacterized protein n=1 Tax=Corchorus olitorius TaxID=93759 RepID=A0A1R3KYI6_9ROSI|nr:hypothetical protein COLO4_03427 [Corchorus olitorius]